MAKRNPVPSALAANANVAQGDPPASVVPTQLEATVVEDSLTPVQRQAIESLTRGRSIKSAAASAGIGRRTLHRWLREDFAFRAAYFSWKSEVQESARARLLSLTDSAVRTVGHALHERDLRAALALLKGLNIFAVPTAGPEDLEECRRWTEMERINREATLMEKENLAYKRRSSAAECWNRPDALQTEDQRNPEAALERHLADLKRERELKGGPQTAPPPTQKEVEQLMRALDKEDLEDDELDDE